jgi:hypothetical protein
MASVAVVSRGINQLDVFGLDGIGGVSRKWWDGVSWHGGFSGEELGAGHWVHQFAVASWGANRLDLVGIIDVNEVGKFELLHKALIGSNWSPSEEGWINRGGDLSPDHEPAIVAWGPNRLDIFALWSDLSMYHKAWDGSNWSDWWPLGGEFKTGPAVASWGPNRLDVFGLGKSMGLYHKAWMGDHWHPPNPSWQGLGGVFAGAFDLSEPPMEYDFPPAVVSWGPDRLDIFGVGESLGMYHKAWTGSSWYPSTTGWQALGGTFRAIQPAVASWGPDRLDIFAIGADHGMYHKAWMGDHWHPANPSWQGLGGPLGAAPEAVAWGPNRLDIFAIGDEEMQHKAWNGSQWEPSKTGWQALGGQFEEF